jgi:hypothetical protein
MSKKLNQGALKSDQAAMAKGGSLEEWMEKEKEFRGKLAERNAKVF